MMVFFSTIWNVLDLFILLEEYEDSLLNSFHGLMASPTLQPVAKSCHHEQTAQCSPPYLPSASSSGFPIPVPPILLSLFTASHFLTHEHTPAGQCDSVFFLLDCIVSINVSCGIIVPGCRSISGLRFCPAPFRPWQFLKWGALRCIVLCEGDIVSLG